ncbi:hypothetical protein A3K29_05225 [Candidatus Collierbacteria bacterium RIFOXYB2_FULL_46_14]|nr:MAG: hypothetical protein A3K29_05225 [Candidatus Collierbacteria bacterium RIFOXYB2_FULL_46_14]OGD76537.1 MAG: hypothetical protein A3K43_05225 [Candidatus Collierbacteria bacterium RIFOXYA2_FULL_46_20]OGD77873.1 MAG: hypothetical protein A3K39_05225 [Candidatus Collierbacteria bacterium RIFOXYC2_FULL_43_15]OGD81163.1 MAG: hypothetical protein A2320_05720 [Pseudomonadales bacterium GWC2_63_15]OGD82595.1 MAG: hypothetical protein A3K36_05225 [Candidatus Collierbacteria bacterium RIFOXYD2_FUL
MVGECIINVRFLVYAWDDILGREDVIALERSEEMSRIVIFGNCLEWFDRELVMTTLLKSDVLVNRLIPLAGQTQYKKEALMCL